MLEMRLAETDGLTDHLVLTEAPVTHRGVPKPVHYGDLKAHLVQQVCRDHKVALVHKAYREHKDQQDHLDFKVFRGLHQPVLLVLKDLKDLQV